MTEAEACRQKIQAIVDQLGDIELQVLAKVAERLLGGQEEYGTFKEDDPRDMRKELFEEILDCQVYAARELVRRGRTSPGI